MDSHAHTRLPGPLFRGLKRVRDAAADALAVGAARSRAVERAMVAAGRALNGRSEAWKLFYRRATESFVNAVEARGPELRRMRVGDVEIVGEVAHFSYGAPYFTGTPYEPATTALVLDTLRPGDAFVDVGANHGYFTVLAALRVGSAGRVAAFEPNPAVSARLRAVLAANGVAERVTVVEAALAEAPAEAVAFYVAPAARDDGLSTLEPSPEGFRDGVYSEQTRIAVQAVTYDTWAEDVGIGRVALMKIDVEGAEERVLRGMARTLAENPPAKIICETSAGGAADRLLRDAGYSARPLEVRDGVYGNWLYEHAG